MSLPNTRIVVTGTVRADVAVTAVEVSNRQAKRASEVLEREVRLLNTKMKRELDRTKAELRRAAAARA